jgi:hypothetical protein
MWPYLFGSGWIWNVLVSAGVLAAAIAVIRTLLVGANDDGGKESAGRDRRQWIWHRYEEGDLTPWEFARLISPRPAVQYSAAAAAKMPGPRSAPAH